MADEPTAPALRGGASASWTVQRVLAWMTQDFTALAIPTPRLDAELLMCRALECDRVRLYMDMQRPLDARELEAARALVVRRRKREPVAYILGRREFYRHSFEVTRDVLIPRPETEVLVDRALELLPAETDLRALDLCTGSGAIAITLALERPQLQVDATDISQGALDVAARNAVQLDAADQVHFHHGDLFEALPEARGYALVVANPPYVANDEWSALAPEIRDHEPRAALLAGGEGLDVLARLCADVAEWLEPGASLLFEVGHTQAPRVMELLQAQRRFEAVVAHKDLAGVARIVGARLRG
jgi:release factor glutamine methyltransferase